MVFVVKKKKNKEEAGLIVARFNGEMVFNRMKAAKTGEGVCAFEVKQGKESVVEV